MQVLVTNLSTVRVVFFLPELRNIWYFGLPVYCWLLVNWHLTLTGAGIRPVIERKKGDISIVQTTPD